MKPKTWAHPKFTHLQRRLKISPALAAGILEGLWHLTATFDDEGGRMPHTGEQLASWLGVDIDGDAIITALVDCGWLDATPGGLVVHDWKDHRPHWITDRIRKRKPLEPPRTSGPPPEPSRSFPEPSRCFPEIPCPASASASASALGSPSEKEKNTCPSDDGRAPTKRSKSKEYTDQFEGCWAIYPRTDAKFAASRAFAKAVGKVGIARVMAAVTAFAPLGKKLMNQNGKNVCPMFSTWLNGERWKDWEDNPTIWTTSRPSRVATDDDLTNWTP